MDGSSKSNGERNFGAAEKEPRSPEMKILSGVETWSNTLELGWTMYFVVEVLRPHRSSLADQRSAWVKGNDNHPAHL